MKSHCEIQFIFFKKLRYFEKEGEQLLYRYYIVDNYNQREHKNMGVRNSAVSFWKEVTDRFRYISVIL